MDVCKALAELKRKGLGVRKSGGDQNPGGDSLNGSPGV